jgi:hypothetical protein
VTAEAILWLVDLSKLSELLGLRGENSMPHRSGCFRILNRKFFGALFALITMGAASSAQYVPGTLSETTTSGTPPPSCTERISTYNWKFTDTLGDAHSFAAPTETIVFEGCTASTSCNPHGSKQGCLTYCGCLPSTTTSRNEWSTDGNYYLEATGGSGKVTSVSGYVNPKYLIMGVTYAPPGGNNPGTGSSVSYADTNYVGNTSTNSGSFSKNFTYGISVCAAVGGDATCSNGGGGLLGFGGGVAITGSLTKSTTQASNTSNTVTTSKQTTVTQLTPGIPDYYTGVDHDYDIVWLWLNPVANFTFVPTNTNGTAGNLYWNAYGYDWNDPAHDVDERGILVGYLNGDFKYPNGSPCYATDPNCDPGDYNALQRVWVTTQVFGSGTAAITQADLANICAHSDPFCSNPGYLVTLEPGVSPATTTDQRYTLTPSATQDFEWGQAGPNSTRGEQQTFNQQYSTTTSQSQGGTNTYSQTFGLEEKFSAGFFWTAFQFDLTQKWTQMWVNSWQNTITNTSTQTDIAQITTAPCPSLTAPCVPAVSEPTEFDVYQDNLYGTFMFWPNPYFTASATPATQMVTAGGSATFSLPTTANAGYSGTLTFNVTGLPSGASPTFSPSSGAAGSYAPTLTITTNSSTPAGTYPLTIIATDGKLVYDTCIASPGGCPITGEPYATLVVTSQPSFSVAVSPTTQTIGIGAGTSYTVTTTATNGFSGIVDLNVDGLPPNSSASFNPETITGSGSSTLTVNTTGNTPPGAYPLTYTGTSGNLNETAPATLDVTGANFTVSAAPEIQSINAGGRATYTVTTTVLSGFDGVVTLTLGPSPLPTGVSYTFSPTSITGAGSSTLTIITTSSTPAKDYQLSVTGTSGNLTQSAPVDLEVSN